MENLYQKQEEAAAFIRSKFSDIPPTAVQLGTGLGNVVDSIYASIPYSEIPHFPKSNLQGHKGELQIAQLGEKKVLVLSGRYHYYEGYNLKEVSFPIRVVKALGIEKLIITNVTGGLNEAYAAGDLVFVNDHINLLPENPLRGLDDPRLGIRFPDMKDAYTPALLAKARKSCEKNNFEFNEGVYVCLQGPSLETKAEYNFLHNIGADMVGMSTVPEVIVAKQVLLPILVISCISNVCFPIERITETTVEEVIAVAKKSSFKMKKLIADIL